MPWFVFWGWFLASTRSHGKTITAEQLKRRGWREGDLLARRKKDPVKLAIAARPRRETTLSLKAIATRPKFMFARLLTFTKPKPRRDSLYFCVTNFVVDTCAGRVPNRGRYGR
jgi:hypothetical protein